MVALAAACGAGQNYESPRALADALADAGITCADLLEAPAATGSEATAECRTSDGRDIGLQVHRDAEQARTMVAGADLTLEGTNRKALVHDGQWIVYVDDDRTANEVQDALGGEITQVATADG
jgi:hypothetical protein